MNSLHRGTEDDDVDEPLRMNGTRDREITLGTTMILGIFFALAVFAAVFFGFGYSMGAKHAATVVTGPADGGSASFSSFKPAAGNPLGTAAKAPPVTVAATVPFTPPPPAVTAPAVRAGVRPADAVAAGDPIPAALPVPVRPRTAPVETPVPAATVATGTSIVQVAAVSHQEDADLLVATLKRKGYAVAIRSEPQDKLLHVQIGPYAGHKEADLMRQRLQADGFNAIVKDRP